MIKRGTDELFNLTTSDEVLHHALRLSLLLTGGSIESGGYIMKRIAGETWKIEGKIEGEKNISVSGEIMERLSGEEVFFIPKYINDEICRFIPEDLPEGISRIIPISVDGILTAALLLKDKGGRDLEPQQDICLSLISKYVSIILSTLQLKDAIREMRVHYEDIISKKETAEKLASLGTIAAGLAHEIKNPLVSLKTLAQLLPERFDDPEFRDHFANIAITEVDRIGHIVSDLLDFAKSSGPKFEPLDIKSFIDNIIEMFSSQFKGKRIVVIKRLVEPLPLIYADHSQMKQVFLNIFINSMEAMPLGGEIIVEAAGDKDIIEGERIIMKITDTGSGIREEEKAHLFEPFFTTKDAGTGLGLSICRRIIERHQGEIYIESEYNRGTTVTLLLPMSLRG